MVGHKVNSPEYQSQKGRSNSQCSIWIIRYAWSQHFNLFLKIRVALATSSRSTGWELELVVYCLGSDPLPQVLLPRCSSSTHLPSSLHLGLHNELKQATIFIFLYAFKVLQLCLLDGKHWLKFSVHFFEAPLVGDLFIQDIVGNTKNKWIALRISYIYLDNSEEDNKTIKIFLSLFYIL